MPQLASLVADQDVTLQAHGLVCLNTELKVMKKKPRRSWKHNIRPRRLSPTTRILLSVHHMILPFSLSPQLP